MIHPQKAVYQIASSPRLVKPVISVWTAAFLFCFALSFQASALVLNFANLPGTEVNFSGGAFGFTSAGGYQFDITSVGGGIGDSVGLDGYITPAGPFTIQTISAFGPGQTASVTGSGVLHITDASSIDLTGNVQWSDITTIGVGGILNFSGSINLTGLHYTGLNSDLSALAAAGSASDVLSFQFLPAHTLTQLDTTGGQTSYSGSIGAVSEVPEPSTLALAGLGLAGLLARSLRRKK
jgi:hypothetical protein